MRVATVPVLFATALLACLSCQTRPPAPVGGNARDSVARVSIDLDIDSDNTLDNEPPDRDAAEDAVEDVAGDDLRPGKVVFINDESFDDIIPDYADGYDLRAQDPQDDVADGASFTPLVLELSDPDADVIVRLTYEASDPAGARPGAPKKLDPFAVMATGFPYELPPGRLRLWAKDGDERRDKRPVAQGGDYLAPGDYQPGQLGLRPGAPPALLYAETVRVSDRVADVVIRVQVLAADRRRTVLADDQVRMTATKFVLLGRGYDPRLDGGTAEDIRAAEDDEKAPQLFEKSAGREQGPFRPSLGLITSDLSRAPTHGSTPGLFEVHKVRVYDPRRAGVAPLLVFGEAVNLVRGDAYHESEEFVVVERGDEINWKVPFKVVQIAPGAPEEIRTGPYPDK